LSSHLKAKCYSAGQEINPRFFTNDQREAQIPFYVFIFIYKSLYVSSTSCSSSGEENCINKTSGNCHSENR